MRVPLCPALLAAVVGLGCAREPDPAPAPRAPGITTAAALAEVPVPATPDRIALAEIIAAAPVETSQPTAKERTLVGSDTGLTADEVPPTTDGGAGTPQAQLVAGAPEIQPLLSSPAI